MRNSQRELDQEICVATGAEGEENPPWRKEADDYYKLELTVDSGAYESVTPKDTIPGMIPGTGKHREPYYAANGTEIGNYGEIGIRGMTSEKSPLSCTMQVAGVNKLLVATIDMVRKRLTTIIEHTSLIGHGADAA